MQFEFILDYLSNKVQRIKLKMQLNSLLRQDELP